MDNLEHRCEDCDGAGAVTLTAPGAASPEREPCETCGGTGVDVPALQAAYRGCVDEIVAALRERYKSPEDPKANDYGRQGREAAKFIERRLGGQ